MEFYRNNNRGFIVIFGHFICGPQLDLFRLDTALKIAVA